MSDYRIKFGNFNLQYNNSHDLAAIIESYVLNVYRIQKIKKGSIVVDVGAGIGEFTVIASKRVGNEGRVIAIEPSPEDFKTLQYNVRENKCSNVIPINSAVSNKKEKLSLTFKEKNFESEADTLHNIIQKLRVPVNSIHYMKMDIEGAERFVIPSSIDIIKNIDYLAMEIHDGFSSELILYMINQGFGFKRIRKNEYIVYTIKKVVLHPTDVYRLRKAYKSMGENPGLAKISSGIEISKSDKLVVGLFFKLNIIT